MKDKICFGGIFDGEAENRDKTQNIEYQLGKRL